MIGGCCIVISIYVLIFPDIIISKPRIKLSVSDNELIAERCFGELFNDGKLIEGYKDLRFEWYQDGQRTGNGDSEEKGMKEELRIDDTKGTFQVVISPPNCEKIKSNVINLQLLNMKGKPKTD